MNKQSIVMVAVIAAAAAGVTVFVLKAGPMAPESAVTQFLRAVETKDAGQAASHLAFEGESSDQAWSRKMEEILKSEFPDKFSSAGLEVASIGQSADNLIEVSVAEQSGTGRVIFRLKKVAGNWQIVDYRSGELDDILAIWHAFCTGMEKGDLAAAKKCVSKSFSASPEVRSLKILESSYKLKRDESVVFSFGTEGVLLLASEAGTPQEQSLKVRFVLEDGQWRIAEIILVPSAPPARPHT